MRAYLMFALGCALVAGTAFAAPLEFVGAGWLAGNPTGANDGAANPAIASAGDVFVVVYQSKAGGDLDLYTTRSFDGGLSWSAGTLLMESMATDTVSDSRPALATGIDDELMLMWLSSAGLLWTTSQDAGETWASPSTITSPVGSLSDQKLQYRGGQWELLLKTVSSGSRFYLLSSANGLAWQSKVSLSISSSLNAAYPIGIAVSPVGTSLATLPYQLEFGSGFRLALSPAAGAPWASYVPTGPAFSVASQPAWAAHGGWLLAYPQQNNSVVVMKSENGNDWSSPSTLFPERTSGTESGILFGSSQTKMQVLAFTSFLNADGAGSDGDVLFSTSTDGWQNWTSPQLFNTGATSDSVADSTAAIGTDDAGRWVLLWKTARTGLSDFVLSYATYAEDPRPRLYEMEASQAMYRIGEAPTIYLRFSHPVVNVDGADFVFAADGSADAGTATVTQNDEGYALILPDAVGEGSITVSVASDNDIEDALENPLEETGLSAAVTIDLVAPQFLSATLVTPPETYSGDWNEIDFEFSEPVTAVDVDDFTVNVVRGTVVEKRVEQVGLKWRLRVRVRDDVDDDVPAACSLQFAASSDIQDAAGNAAERPPLDVRFASAYLPVYVVGISPPAEHLQTNVQYRFTISFNRPVSGFDINDVIVPGGTTIYSLLGGPTEFRLNVKFSQAGQSQISIPSDTDIKGTEGTPLRDGFASAPFGVWEPLQVTSFSFLDSLVELDEPLVADIKFNRTVTGFDVSDLSFNNTSPVFAEQSLSGGPQNFQLTLTGSQGIGSGNLRFATDNDVKDENGLPLALPSAISFAVTVDGRPKVALFDLKTVNPPPVFTINYNEPVLDVDAGDFVIEGPDFAHSAATLVALSPQIYELSIPNLTGQGTLSFRPAAAYSCEGLDGDPCTEAEGQSWAFLLDITPPQLVSFKADKPVAHPGDDVLVTMTFNEAVEVPDSAISISSTGLVYPKPEITGTGSTRQIVFSDVQGTGRIDVSFLRPDLVMDTNGTAMRGTPPALRVTVAFPPPELQSLAVQGPQIVNSGDLDFILTFDQNVVGLDIADLVITTDGTATHQGATILGSGASRTLRLKSVRGNGTLHVSINPANNIASEFSIPLAQTALSAMATVDTIRPVVTAFVSHAADLEIGDEFEATLTFSEPVTGFSAADLIVLQTLEEGLTWEVIQLSGQSYEMHGGPLGSPGKIRLGLASSMPVVDAAGNKVTATTLVAEARVGGPPHHADLNGDWHLDLGELLRIVQLYNAIGFGCAAGTEDGFEVASPEHDCLPHTIDYAPQDWLVSLSELLRAVQFLNNSRMSPCPEEEDGFCAM